MLKTTQNCWLMVLLTTCFPPLLHAQVAFQAPKPVVDLPADKPAPPPQDGTLGPESFLPPVVLNPWCGGVELGINGAEGNSQNFTFRLGGSLRRKTEDNVFTLDLLYTLASINDIRTQNRLFTLARDECYLKNSPWGYFADVSLEYDEFKAFDIRVALHGGVAYRFIDNASTLLKARAGAGVSREFGGPNNDWTPEFVLGGDWEHRFNDTTKLFTTADFFPSVTDFADYRLQLAVGLETMLSKEHNLCLKIGIQELYDSTPEGRKPADLTYFAALLWKF